MEARAERIFVMVKPDGVQRGFVGEVIARFEKRGFKLVGMKFKHATEDLLRQHYENLIYLPFFPKLLAYILSGPVVAMVWEGLNAVSNGRKMVGATKPADSLPGTIRGDFALDVGRNVVHASDSVDSANREISLWFNEMTYYGILTFTLNDELTNAGKWLMCVFQSFIWLSILSHLRCIFTSPGLTPRMDAPDIPLEELKFCDKCQQWKPPRTHHCSTCRHCVHRVRSMQMDHHCPWVNNCVAVKTHKYFLLFILYFGLAGIMGACVLAYVGYDYLFWKRRYRMKILSLIFATGGATASAFFGLLSVALVWEQMSKVVNNQTTLDEWQKLQPVNVISTQGSLIENMSRVFGDNYWAWMLPVAPSLRIDYKEELLAVPQHPTYSKEKSTCRKAMLALSLALAAIGGGLTLLYFWRF